MGEVLTWGVPAALALLGAVVGELVRRRLSTRSYRYPDERTFAEPRQWWLIPLAALVWGGLAWGLLHRPATLVVFLLLTVPLLALAGIDQDVHRLPDRIQKPLMLLVPLLLLVPAAIEGEWGAWVRALVGGLIALVVYYLLAVVGQGGLGLGDVKLAPILGMACAWFSWIVLGIGLVAGFFLGAIWGIWLMIARGASRKDYIPLGPFLIVGALGTVAVLA
ncbi:prepilin peptidase [Ornithinimicrobium sp. Y1847]|uniref:prepilin peptidase n=1 Tax=Ornithinimicrobium sp. Y1847 TaxID=3405419 RepID=UPI003B67D6A7